jgi:hypothetical protein
MKSEVGYFEMTALMVVRAGRLRVSFATVDVKRRGCRRACKNAGLVASKTAKARIGEVELWWKLRRTRALGRSISAGEDVGGSRSLKRLKKVNMVKGRDGGQVGAQAEGKIEVQTGYGG